MHPCDTVWMCLHHRVWHWNACQSLLCRAYTHNANCLNLHPSIGRPKYARHNPHFCCCCWRVKSTRLVASKQTVFAPTICCRIHARIAIYRLYTFYALMNTIRVPIIWWWRMSAAPIVMPFIWMWRVRLQVQSEKFFSFISHNTYVCISVCLDA